MTETSTAMKFLGGFGVLAAVVGPTFLVSQYVNDLRNDVTSSKAEVERLKGQVEQLQVILDKTQVTISSGSRGPKGDKGETGLQGEKGEIGPPGPQGQVGAKGDNGESVDAARLAEIEKVLQQLTSQVAADPATSSKTNFTTVTASTLGDTFPDLKGTWRGNVSCKSRGYTVTLSLLQQNEQVASGTWRYRGSSSGETDVSLEPAPVRDDPSRYIIATEGNNALDYHVTVNGNTIAGKAISDDCDIKINR